MCAERGGYGGAAASSLAGRDLSLAVASPGDSSEPFFRGRITPGDLIAGGLLVVARVARARFVMSSGERAAVRDPVLTVDASGIHVESFSDDCGVHARFSVLPAALDAERWEPGTVNVDFNEPMRAALAGVRGGDPLSVEIDRGAVGLTASDVEVTEPRVKLPDRWVRGFAEVQVAAADLSRLAHFDGAPARRILSSLPRGQGGKNDLWGRPALRGLQLTRVPSAGAIWISAPDRVRLLDPLIRWVKGLDVFGHAGRQATTVWAADLGVAQLMLSLSPHRTRGFTGEGNVLYALVDPGAAADAGVLEAFIGNRRRFSQHDLKGSELPDRRVKRALELMGAHGTLGYDPLSGEWFRRSLPFTVKQLLSTPPRLKAARMLVDGGRVAGEELAYTTVTGDHGVYTVEVDPPGCECRWWHEYPGDRGPCRHILAALLHRQAVD